MYDITTKHTGEKYTKKKKSGINSKAIHYTSENAHAVRHMSWYNRTETLVKI